MREQKELAWLSWLRKWTLGERLLSLCEAAALGVQSVEPGEAWLDTKRGRNLWGQSSEPGGSANTCAWGNSMGERSLAAEHPPPRVGRQVFPSLVRWSGGQGFESSVVLWAWMRKCPVSSLADCGKCRGKGAVERTGNGGGASKGGAPAFTAKCGQRLVLPRVRARDQLHDLGLESPPLVQSLERRQ